MSRVIHKLPLTEFETSITVSAGAFRVLTVHRSANDIPTVWYETLENPIIPIGVKFQLIPTGGEVPDHSQYVGTTFGEKEVWHVYQIPAL